MTESSAALSKAAVSAIANPAVETIALQEAPPEVRSEARMDDNIVANIA